MKNIEIEENFNREYLTCGNTYDNFIFHKCPKSFLHIAQDRLSKDNNGVRPCLIRITRDDEEIIENMLKEYEDYEFYKTIICRDYVNARVLNEVYSRVAEKGASKSVLNEHVKAFKEGELWKVKKHHVSAPFMYEIVDAYKKYGSFEIDFFLEDTENVFIQKAINNFISTRAPFTVKVFTNKDKLPTYYDEGGNIIECPHDYMTRNVNNFISIKEDEELPEF